MTAPLRKPYTISLGAHYAHLMLTDHEADAMRALAETHTALSVERL